MLSYYIMFGLIVLLGLAILKWIARVGIGIVGLFLILLPAALHIGERVDLWGFGCAALGVLVLCADVARATRRKYESRQSAQSMNGGTPQG